ncbi:MAG: hypothetical protein QW318_09035 [Candidatus Caldarchaeum sp.]
MAAVVATAAALALAAVVVAVGATVALDATAVVDRQLPEALPSATAFTLVASSTTALDSVTRVKNRGDLPPTRLQAGAAPRILWTTSSMLGGRTMLISSEESSDWKELDEDDDDDDTSGLATGVHIL